jgi:transitional endoplasmic reticulum ATPase
MTPDNGRKTMLDQYESAVLLRYYRNLAIQPMQAVEAYALEKFTAWARICLNMPERDVECDESERTGMRHECKLIAKATRSIQLPDECSGLQNALNEITRAVGLSPVEAALVGVIIRYDIYDVAMELFDGFKADLRGLDKPVVRSMVAAAIGHRERDVCDALSRHGTLIRLGILDPDNLSSLPKRVREFLLGQANESISFRDFALGTPLATDHAWADFEHLGPDRVHLVDMLAGAIQHRRKGVNILIYGIPGGGKTEFCKALAKQLGMPLYAVAEMDEDDQEPSRRERLAALHVAHRLLGESSNALLLVDEADDIIASERNLLGYSSRSGSRSRAFIHRVLECTPCPTIWVMNEIDGIETSVLRRMTYALEVRTPTRRVRERLWREMLDRHAIPATESDIRHLSISLRSPPAIAATAVRSARLSGGSIEDVMRTASSLVRVINGGRLPQTDREGDADFDPRLFTPSVDMKPIEAQAAMLSGRPVSFCLYGPPGTGKSAWLRRLAALMDMEVLHKRASDLLSMWLGGTERQIAEVFREAADDRAFLIIDEADSLLMERNKGRKSWENSAVNELLTWMDQHPIPFGMTTNHVDHLDRASLRRFTFRIECSYLKPDQARHAFESFFGLPAPLHLGRLDRLTPSDFALVRKQVDLLDHDRDPNHLLILLEDHMVLREGERRTIGFAA